MAVSQPEPSEIGLRRRRRPGSSLAFDKEWRRLPPTTGRRLHSNLGQVCPHARQVKSVPGIAFEIRRRCRPVDRGKPDPSDDDVYVPDLALAAACRRLVGITDSSSNDQDLLNSCPHTLFRRRFQPQRSYDPPRWSSYARRPDMDFTVMIETTAKAHAPEPDVRPFVHRKNFGKTCGVVPWSTAPAVPANRLSTRVAAIARSRAIPERPAPAWRRPLAKSSPPLAACAT